jgi:hypothetical protein
MKKASVLSFKEFCTAVVNILFGKVTVNVDHNKIVAEGGVELEFSGDIKPQIGENVFVWDGIVLNMSDGKENILNLINDWMLSNDLTTDESRAYLWARSHNMAIPHCAIKSKDLSKACDITLSQWKQAFNEHKKPQKEYDGAFA